MVKVTSLQNVTNSQHVAVVVVVVVVVVAVLHDNSCSDGRGNPCDVSGLKSLLFIKRV